jgi:antitoxin component of RelBE/YafQ-DinJ toxin-antitoxin module
MVTRQRQVKTTLVGDALNEFDELFRHLGLCPSETLKLAVRRLAQNELKDNKLASLELREAA